MGHCPPLWVGNSPCNAAAWASLRAAHGVVARKGHGDGKALDGGGPGIGKMTPTLPEGSYPIFGVTQFVAVKTIRTWEYDRKQTYIYNIYI